MLLVDVIVIVYVINVSILLGGVIRIPVLVPQYESSKWNCSGLKGSLLSTGNSNFAFLTNGKISSQKALFVCVKNNGSSGGVQLLPPQCDCRHHEQVLCENTLFSRPSNSSCCLPLNLLRVC